MPDSDFESTWYPRMGKDAAEQLRRLQRSVWFVPLGLVFSLGAGALFGTSSAGDAIGGVCVLGAVICLGLWINAQWRTAAAASVWFGVKRRWWLPRMTPQRFDEWRTANGFRTPDERRADAEMLSGDVSQTKPTGQ
jgi:hypothetical protein